MKNFRLAAIVLFLAISRLTVAAEWQPLATDLLKSEKTGFGGLCGVVVDHKTGDLWVNLSDRGMFHSGDQGRTWKRMSETQPKGRTETPGCWLLDPTGKSGAMVTALVYGAPISISTDRGATWKQLDNKSGHVDWCAVDWGDPEMKFVLALKHEAGGLLLASNDGGKSFVEAGKGFGPGWVFDGQTAVVAKVKSKETPIASLMRTTDGGKTFKPCGEFNPVGTNSAQALPKWRSGSLSWLTDAGLIISADKGESWKSIGSVKDAQYGPIFGKDTKHMLILTKAGVVESSDGGSTWSPPLVPPKVMKGTSGLAWLEYDPVNEAIYLMKMGSDLYRFAREK
jgi:hypothetical protein